MEFARIKKNIPEKTLESLMDDIAVEIETDGIVCANAHSQLQNNSEWFAALVESERNEVINLLFDIVYDRLDKYD